MMGGSVLGMCRRNGEEAAAILETAAVFIGALVERRGEELRDQITVAAVERNGVHAALLGQLRAVGKLALDLVDAVDGEDFAGIIGIFAGGRRGFARRDGRLAAVVDQLDGDAHVIFSDIIRIVPLYL